MKSRTLALVVAGRSLDSYLTTHGMLERLRSITAEVPGLEVIVATNETAYDSPPSKDEPLDARVVIGIVVTRAQSEVSPGETAAPLAIDVQSVEAGLEKARAIDGTIWMRLAAVLPRKVLGYTAAARRASLSPEQREEWAGVAFNGPDLLDTTDRVHLVATGPLATAILTRGSCETLPPDGDDDDLDDEDDCDDEVATNDNDTQLPLKRLIFVKGNNERPAVGVRGKELARVSIEGHGAIALSPNMLTGELYLLAQYD
ncbi:MAG: hypothetical protein U0271_33560 [Polyangiaceae bacterium]